MPADVEVLIPGAPSIKGSHPLIVLGPNGSGKTRLGTKLRATGGIATTRIPALRNLELPQDIQIAGRSQAKGQLEGEFNRSQNNPWVLANDITWLMADLVAEDAESATKYRNAARLGSAGKPPETSLTKLMDFWGKTFPGRSIDLSSYRPQVTSILSGASLSYPATQMSDGERVAIYLAARVLHAPPGLIVVDEPEVHFHSLLARRLWSGLEALRSDCRFVYITHDLAFTGSRRDAQYIIARPGDKHDVLPREAEIPDEVIGAVLGAASFSVTAQRLVFCEGTIGKDDLFYQAWFDPETTAVVAVGSCADVAQCVTVVNSGRTVRGVKAVGIVDRDYWPDNRIAQLQNDGVHVLPVHEIESLYCLPLVYKAIAQFIAVEDYEAKYQDFVRAARNAFKGVLLHKQALERAKTAIDKKVVGLLNGVAPTDNLVDMRASLVKAADPASWGFDPGSLLDEELTVVKGAHASAAGVEEFLRIFPGKTYFEHAAASLGLKGERYRELVAAALTSQDGQTVDQATGMSKLKADLIAALAPHLPSRTGP
jgi:energy-coupling factor transporter ATP-binding protein EcfA2